MSQIILDESAAPSTPASGKVALFVGTDGIAYTKDDTGLVSRAGSNVTLKSAITAGGTSIDFTGIPSDAKEIVIGFAGLSTGGTSDLLVQLGDAEGFETTGYLSTAFGTTPGVGTSTAGFNIRNFSGASVFSGHMLLTLVDSATNTWASSHSMKASTTSYGVGGGDKSLSGVLTQVRITSSAADTFDAGKINLSYKA